MEPTDGGPAFPQGVAVAPGESPRASYDFVDGAGMSLRDYFAGQAICAKADWQGMSPKGIAALVQCAYQIADAMLAEKAKS